MKKLVGFIFMLVLSLTLSMTAYAADDLGSVIAKVAVDKKKDKKKKKVKKGKKNKKKAKKDLPVAELSVKSASKIWTNDVDISTLNIEEALNELIIGKDGYHSAPDEVIAFYNKYPDVFDVQIDLKTAAGEKSNYLVLFTTPYGKFKFLTKDSLVYFECFAKPNYDLKGYDINDFLDRLKLVGLDIDMTPKQLESICDYGLKARFKVGNVFWDIEGTRRSVEFKRVTNKFVNFTMSDVFKACAKHRLVFTDNFYSKFSKLMNIDFITILTDSDNHYDGDGGIRFNFSSITEGNLGVDFISYRDDPERHKTTLQIAGNINIDTRVEDLSKILDEYVGIDLYTFDTSRIKNMLIDGIIQEFSVYLEHDLGDSHVEVSVANNGERTYQFSVILTRKY